jgi:hypothetical protein
MVAAAIVPVKANATGEIAFVRAPEEIPEGDDITVIISASARETGIDRTLAIDYPASWKLKRAYRVEAGSDHTVRLQSNGEVRGLFAKEPNRDVIALADLSDDFDPDADGIAYFIVFSTKQLPGSNPDQTSTVKAGLVERTSPNAPPVIDSKTKKPKPINMNWWMVFPPKYEFSFAGITTKRLVATVRLDRITRNSRALAVEGHKDAVATLHTKPEILEEYFSHPFSVGFWFRTTGVQQSFLRFGYSGGGELRLGTGLLGEPLLMVKNKVVISPRTIVNDGAWHNLVLSCDSGGKLRMFIDAESPVIIDGPKGVFHKVSSIEIGNPASDNDFSIDELRLMRGAYHDPLEFENRIATAERDTSHDAEAIFHFDEFGQVARSSVPLLTKVAPEDKGEFIPVFFALDSGARLQETSSPVQLDPVMLSVDLNSSTQVGISWKTTSELGIKQFRLERRIGTYGAFEKVLAVEAKHGMKAPKRGQSVVSRNNYSAQEDLPKLNGDIELYYRLAVVGFNEKESPYYSIPVKLEYGADRDVFVEQNQPNPFNPMTVIAFRLTKPETIRLSVFDIIGREVALLFNGKLDAGRHAYSLDATNWPGGIYFYKVKTSQTTITRKMVLAK